MADDPYDFLSPDVPVSDEPVITPPAPEPVTPPIEVPVEPAAVVPPVETPVTPPEVTPASVPVGGPGFVPITGLLDEREKRQAAERELAELRKSQTARVAPPSITDDPEAWAAAHETRLSQRELDQTMRLSGRFAAQHYGQEKVSAAMAWGKDQTAADPYFGPKFIAQEDPFGWLVEQHRQATTLGMLGKETPEEWAIKYAASQGYAKPSGEPPVTQQPPAVATAPVQPTPPTAPPKSIAGATPAGGSSTPVTLQEQEVAEFWSK